MAEFRGIYKCNVCGNIVEVLHSGAGELVCCGQNMELFKENTVDAAREKHVPKIENNGENFLIKVGEVAHPMEEEHFIEWIETETDKGFCKKFLKPGDSPEIALRAKEVKSARTYCNIHGLWRS